jgi:hypothetical protein
MLRTGPWIKEQFGRRGRRGSGEGWVDVDLRCAIPPRTLRKRSGGETTHRCVRRAALLRARLSRRGLMTRRRCRPPGATIPRLALRRLAGSAPACWWWWGGGQYYRVQRIFVKRRPKNRCVSLVAHHARERRRGHKEGEEKAQEKGEMAQTEASNKQHARVSESFPARMPTR